MTLPLIAGCSATSKVRAIGCPVPSFLVAVKPAALNAGDDLRPALLKRSAELDTANSRIIRARAYMIKNCAKETVP